jgi:Protein of unknown function (DUF3455)
MPKNPGQSVGEYTDIPDVLKVPEGNVLLVRAQGEGIQKYRCPIGPKPTAVPHAILRACDGGGGDIVAIHFQGPTWEALDGSSVVGDAQNATHFSAPDHLHDVDWLLVPAKSTAGDGLLSKVTYIQRLFTEGGQAPAKGCDQAHNQTEVLVEYSAEYRFYCPATAQR